MRCGPRHVSPALIQIEAQIITQATYKGLWGQDGGEMSVRASPNSRQASFCGVLRVHHSVVCKLACLCEPVRLNW